MSNPLIDKFYELHPEKREKPKPDYYKGEKSIAEELEELEKLSTTNVNLNSLSVVAASVSAITAANPYPASAITASNHIPPSFKTLTSYDTHSGKDSFLQIAEKVKNGDAKVSSMSAERDIMRGTTITFEVQVWDT